MSQDLRCSERWANHNRCVRPVGHVEPHLTDRGFDWTAAAPAAAPAPPESQSTATSEALVVHWQGQSRTHAEMDSRKPGDIEGHEHFRAAAVYKECALALLAALRQSAALRPSEGPETGDRERLRAIATASVQDEHDLALYGSPTMASADDGAGHAGEYDTCSHPDCVLVRQAAPAASEGQK